MAEIKPSKNRGSGRRKKHGGKKEVAMGRHSLPIPLGALGIAGNLIQVEVSVLHPQIHFKTLPVSTSTTVYEVICTLVEKHAIEMKDQNPGSFFLRECVENSQGSYTQVVGDKEQVLDVQHKWKEGNIGYFKLCKRAERGNSSDEEEGATSGVSPPLHATVLSPAEFGDQSDASSRGDDSPLPMSPTYAGTRSAGTTSSPLHQMIRDSAAEGLSGVMSKVVSEVDQSTERRGKSRSGTPPKWWERSGQSSPDPANIALPASPADLCRESPLLLRHSTGVAIVQPLEYSPSVSAKREFPEFVIAGGDSPEKRRDIPDHVKERRRPYSEGCRPASQESISSSTSSKRSLPIDSSEAQTVHIRQLSPVKQIEIQDTPPLLSEMNLLDSLAQLIDRPYIVGNVSLAPEDDHEEQEEDEKELEADKVPDKHHAEDEKQTAEEPGNQRADDEVPKQHADLISPARKQKLLDEASVQLKGKRSSTSSLTQDSTSDQPSQTETSPKMPSLISSARKERLLNNACDIVRKKQGKTSSDKSTPSPEHTAVQKSTQ